jgi:hypothetical protein
MQSELHCTANFTAPVDRYAERTVGVDDDAPGDAVGVDDDVDDDDAGMLCLRGRRRRR